MHWKQEPALVEFFDNLQKKAAKKNPDPNSTEILNARPPNWIPYAANLGGHIDYTTHPPKMTHPLAGSKSDSADVSQFIVTGTFKNDGFVHSGNTEVELDGSTNAGYLPVLKFLELPLSNGRKVIEHLSDNTDIAQSLLSECDNPVSVRNGLLEAITPKNNTVHSTSGLLPQVYFPVDTAGGYHLLTPLISSSMIFGLKKRIKHRRSSEQAKASREARKKGLPAEPFYEIYNLTGIGFGGTKPANVSNLNSNNAGIAHLLDATPPPKLGGQFIKKPYRDFFSDSCQLPATLLRSFHAMASSSRYVTTIYDWRDGVLERIFDTFVDKVYQLQEQKAGWSEDTGLPHHQRCFIDSAMTGKREDRVAFVEDAVHWFIRCYNQQYKDQAFEMGKTERKFIYTIFNRLAEAAL